MLTDKKPVLSYEVSVHSNKQAVLDQDGVKILETINNTHSILETAKTLNVSYRYVWNYIRRIQKLLNQPVVETFKGGKDGGGGAKLTFLGKSLLAEYYTVERYLADALFASGLVMQQKKLTISNQLKGKVVAVEESEVTSNVDIEVKLPLKITTVIAKEAIHDLGLKVGSEVALIIKSAEIKVEK